MPAINRLPSDPDKLLLRTARHSRWWVGLLGCASLAGALAEVGLPAAVGRALDAILTSADHGHTGAVAAPRATTWLAACALLVAVIVVSGGVVQLATGTAGASATAWLRRQLAAHVLACGPAALRSLPTGDMVSRVVAGTSDAGTAPASVVMAVTAVVSPVASVVALGLIDPWLMVAFLAGFPVLAMVVRAYVRDSSDINADYQRAQGQIATRLVDALAGARTIAAAGTMAEENARILSPLKVLRRHGQASWRVQARASAQGMLVVPVLQVIVLAVSGVLLARHQITAGQLIAASQYAVLAVGIGAAIGQLNRLARARGGARRVSGPLAMERLDYGTRWLARGPGELRFRDVTVRQDGQDMLRGLDLSIPGGSMVAVVGRSGAGKSTLAHLAGRLVDPDQGEISLDGLDLRLLRKTALRRGIVYAFERPALFGLTPSDAIGFGIDQPARRQLLSAARASQAATFIARLPGGMRAPLSALTLSGGEVQRLGLARAFAHSRRAKLLILDDATSSLDTATEMLVSRAVTEQMSGRTRLIVAHRATTAARADLVAWLDGGRLRALAPHRELWAQADYRAIFGAGPDAAC